MSTQPTEEPLRLVVAFNPVPSASRVAHHHATRFRLAVQAFIVVVIGGLLWAALLRKFISERGKIRARRVTGLSVQDQRKVAIAIKNARELALLPYASTAR